MGEKLGESFVLLVLRDAAFRAALKADEKFAEQATARMNASLSKVAVSHVPVTFDLKHLQKSAAVVEAIIGVAAEKWRKIARVPAYFDLRPLRKSLRVLGSDVRSAMDGVAGRARVRPFVDTRAFTQQLRQMSASYAGFLQHASQRVMSPRVSSPVGVGGGVGPGGGGGGGGGGGLGVGGSLLAGAAGGLAADLGVRAFGKAQAGLQSLFQTGMQTNSQMEVLTQSFETLMGSATAGQRVLESMRKFAEVTPFELPEISKVGVQLLSTKKITESQLIPTIAKLGDAAAGSADGFESFPRIARAISQMLNKEKIQAEEMLQLSEAGVPAWTALAKSMGKTVPELQKMGDRGQLGLDAIMKLVDGLGGQFDGLAAKQSKTMQGLTSTWRDQLAMALAKVTKPLFDLQRLSLSHLTEWMNTPQAQRFIETLTNGMAAIADRAKGVGDSVLTWAKNADISGITASIGAVLGMAGKMAGALIAAFQNPVVQAIAKFAALAASISAVAAVASMLAPTVLAAFAPFSVVAAGLAAAAAGLASSFRGALDGEQGTKLRETMSSIWERVKDIGDSLRENLTPIIEAVSAKLAAMVPAGGLSGLWQGAAEVLDSLLAKVQVFSNDFGATWEYVKALGAATVLEWWNRLKFMVTTQAPAAWQGLVEGMAASFVALITSIGDMFVNVFQKAGEAFKSIFSIEGGLFGAIGKEAKSAWSDVGNVMLDAQKRATAAAENTKKTGGSKSDAWLAAGAEIALGVEKGLGRYLEGGIKVAGSTIDAKTEQAKILGGLATDIAGMGMEVSKKQADAFAQAFQNRMGAVGGPGDDPVAVAERERAAKLWEQMQKKTDQSNVKRQTEEKVAAAKEREEAGAKGLADMMQAAKTGLVNWYEKAKEAFSESSASSPAAASKQRKIDFTTNSALYGKVAEALAPKALNTHEAKMEALTTSIRNILAKGIGRPLLNIAIGLPGKVANAANAAGKAIGGAIGGAAAGKGLNPGAAIGPLADAVKSIPDSVKAAGGWLNESARSLGLPQMDEATKEQIRRKAEVQDILREIPDLFEPAWEEPKNPLEGVAKSLGKMGFTNGQGIALSIGEAIDTAFTHLNRLGESSQPAAVADPLMKQQNDILNQSVRIQQSIASGIANLGVMGYGV